MKIELVMSFPEFSVSLLKFQKLSLDLAMLSLEQRMFIRLIKI